MKAENIQPIISSTLKEIIRQIDKAILLGAPLPRNSSLLTKMASKLNDSFASKHHGVNFIEPSNF